MKACYKKLWKLLIDKNIKRTDLKRLAGISSASLAKLGKDENVSMDILQKLCKALDCNIGDIMDMIPEDKKNSKKITGCNSRDAKCPLAGCILMQNEEN